MLGASIPGQQESWIMAGAIATLSIEIRRIEDMAERLKDKPEGATLFGIVARMRDALNELTVEEECPA